MARFVLAAVAVVVLAGGATADNKDNIDAAKAAVATLEKSKDVKERTAAITKLGKLGESGMFKYVEPGIPKVVSALDDKDAGVRAAAALAIGLIGPDEPDEVVKKLASLLKDKDDTVKANAVKGLGSLGPKAKDAVKDLQAAKKEIGDPKNGMSKQIDAAIGSITQKTKK